MFVILNEVKNLMISNESIIEILRFSPQNDIKTQSGNPESIKKITKYEAIFNITCYVALIIEQSFYGILTKYESANNYFYSPCDGCLSRIF
jgi:hypothetical protein